MAEVLATVTGMGRGVAALPSISMAAATGGLTPEQIIAVDGAHLWHPYSSIGREAVSPVVAVAAHGAWLTLIRDGQPIEVLDAMSSWWTAIHGHGHPALDQALTTQLRVMNHVMFGGLTHEPAARLAKLLVDITPAGLDTVFFSDSGSVSVEVAAKMALQYWRGRGLPGMHPSSGASKGTTTKKYSEGAAAGTEDAERAPVEADAGGGQKVLVRNVV